MTETARATRPVGAGGGLEAAVQRALAQRLVQDPPLAELAHVVLAVVITVFLWRHLPSYELALWSAAVTLAALQRASWRGRAQREEIEPQEIVWGVRRHVAILALAWGGGALIFSPRLAFGEVAQIMVVLSGVVAAGMVTLVADRYAFPYLAGGTLIPLSVGIALGGFDEQRVAGLAVIALFGAFTARTHARSYRAAVAHERATVQLAGSEARVRAIVDNAADGILTFDEQGLVRSYNPACERLFGYDTPEVMAMPVGLLIALPHDKPVAQGLPRYLDPSDTAGDAPQEVDACRKDGTRFPIRLAVGETEAGGRRTFTAVVHDVTARRWAESALQDAERHYRELVESASDLVWQVDGRGHWTYLNAAAREIYGREPAELVGRPFREVVHPDSAASDLAAFSGVLAGRDLTDHETVHVDAQGQRRTLGFAARPLRDATGTIVGAHGTARDITAQVAARDATQEARAAAERAAEVRAAFLANMSHEIRTPMNAILGITELVLGTELTPEQRRHLDLVRSSGDALLTLLNDVLDLSKIEAEHLELESIAFDLVVLLESTTGLLAARARARGLDLLADLDPDLPHLVTGDPTRIRQVLTNLIGNAIKFTHKGEVVVKARVLRRDQETTQIHVAVRDSGIGIRAEDVARIFEEFSQADASMTRRYGGTGLGLAIARRLVRRMGSDITVDSRLGEGSEFAFTLSLGLKDGGARPPIAPQAVPLKGRRILVVDDSDTNRKILRGMLGAAGVIVEEAPSATAALAALRQASAPYALVISDVQMPDQDGFALATQIRAEPALASTAILMLTSAGQRGDVKRCRELGVEGYLTKPVGRADLLETVATLLADDPRQWTSAGVVTRYAIAEARRGLRILLAEDNPVNQEVAATMLRRRGHTVDVADDGVSAVEAAGRTRYDAILMDIQMPRLDGFGATKQIRAFPQGADVRIIALTAHALGGERERCLQAGMSGYLSKPFRPADLFAAVEGLDDPAGTRTGSSPQSPEVEPLAHPPVDIAGFRQTMREAGAEDAVEAVLQTFLDAAPKRLAAIDAGLAASDATAVEHAAHALKSAAGSIGAKALMESLRQLEHAGATGDLARAHALGRSSRELADAALTYLRECLRATGAG